MVQQVKQDHIIGNSLFIYDPFATHWKGIKRLKLEAGIPMVSDLTRGIGTPHRQT